MTISSGKEVSIEYTLKLKDETVVDSNIGSDPLTYRHGSRQLIPGFEKALEGMQVGESKDFMVSASDGYGLVDEKAFREVPITQIPEEGRKVGARLQGQDPTGRMFNIRVSEIKQEVAVLDFNHPLAGKDLYFHVKVLQIGDAAPPE